jgi:hypothetical protein
LFERLLKSLWEVNGNREVDGSIFFRVHGTVHTLILYNIVSVTRHLSAADRWYTVTP